MDHRSLNIFSKTASDCLKEPQSPPNMNDVLKRLKRALEFQHNHENPLTLHEPSTIVPEHTIPDHLMLKLKNLEHMKIHLKDISLATRNFSSDKLIALGGFGEVYKGELHHVNRGYCYNIEGENECEVAIKCISDLGKEGAQDGFFTEIEMLTNCEHSNIITLLGFCIEGASMILVYEYAPNKSLVDYLLNKDNTHNASWVQRLKICLGAAMGLSILHYRVGDRPEIVHCDIKSANILLGKKLEAKIGDFGLSKFLSADEVRGRVGGTKGYFDPHHSQEAKLKKEIDVYSFGIVLLEILCGRLVNDPVYSQRNNRGLAFLAQHHIDKGTVMDIVDPKIKEATAENILTSVKGPDQDSVDTFSRIACRCLERQVNRPTMEVVVEELEEAVLFEENRRDIFEVPLEVIKSATKNFTSNPNESAELWTVYEGKVSHASGHTNNIDVKRLKTLYRSTQNAFFIELKVLMEYKHENVISLVGYCDEMDEKIIVYEHSSLGSLDMYLKDSSLKWGERLKICVDIARGLEFLHGGDIKGGIVIHRDIKSSNIRLNGEMKAKIAGFGLSVIRTKDRETVFQSQTIAGTDAYIDPEYACTGLLSKECDIYSFGVVLFEIILRTFAHTNPKEHLGPMIKDLYKEGKLDDLVFEGTNEHIAPQSLTIFKRIGIQCLHDKREERPTAREVVIQLEEALKIQEKGMDIVRISFEDIITATENFSSKRLLGGGDGKVYIGVLPHANGSKTIAAKRLDPVDGHRVLEILFKFKHKNLISLEGYCHEMDEMIIVYEYAPKGSLDTWLDIDNVKWMKRLAICIDIARGLGFLHGGVLRQEAVIHGDIKSANVLLMKDGQAKIANFERSVISSINKEIDYIIDYAAGTSGYVDPIYVETGLLNKACDIYSFGVILFEILCGRSVYVKGQQLLVELAFNYYEQGKLDEIVFKGIKEQIGPNSLATFTDVAYRCLCRDLDQRPSASEVLIELEKALEFQEDYEIWEPKLPTDYQQIIKMSESPEINFKKRKQNLYNMFSEGILLRGGKVSLSMDNNGRKNEMISAGLFSYKDKRWQKRRVIPKSRFQRVSMMLDASNLMIQIKIKTQFLSPNVTYGAHLIFKFGGPVKVRSKLMYVNLKYKMGNETMQTYFAEKRNDEWMQIELFRFFNHREEYDFEVFLESFSKYYCGSGAIYIDGIEFRATDNVKLEELDKLREIQQVVKLNSSMEQLSTDDITLFKNSFEQIFLQSEVDGKKLFVLSSMGFLYDFLKVKFLKWNPSEQSRCRLPIAIEFLSQQVYHIKCKIESHVLSPETDYMCYLIFKLSEKCHGLHCPVKVRNLVRRKNKEVENLYFRFPTLLNLHDIEQVPKQRQDEWMEVRVWKFNSGYYRETDCIPIPINLKLSCYEGTMAGLIVYGLEFRPM